MLDIRSILVEMRFLLPEFVRAVFASMIFALIFAMTASSIKAESKAPRILAVGDSLLAIHAITGRNVVSYLERYLDEPVADRSVLGARMIYKLPISGAMGLSIPKQYRDGDWDWVVMNGGGNDLWLGCGCHECERRLNRLISADGTRGEIPQMMARIHKTGAKVLYVGYLRSPGILTPIESCKDEGDALEARIEALAARVEGVHYLSIQDLVPRGDTSYLAVDGIHPSIKASREIAARVARFIKREM